MQQTGMLNEPLFWIAIAAAFLIGIICGLSMHRGYTHRERIRRARMHLHHLFSTGQVHSIKYVPVRGWFRDRSRVLAVTENGEFEIPDHPEYKREHTPEEAFAGFSSAETCAAADELRSNPQYISSSWVPGASYKRKAWVIKRRDTSQQAA